MVPLNDEQFLDMLQRASWEYFNKETCPRTGMVPDKVDAVGTKQGEYCSVAGIGFGLTGLCIADHRKWISTSEAKKRAIVALEYAATKLDRKEGFFYHFYNMDDSTADRDVEISNIDTALFLQGAITAREYFNDPTITKWVNKIYEEVNWPWMLNGGDTMVIGWKENEGFQPWRWEHFSEHMAMYIMAIGANKTPLDPKVWQAWKREPVITYKGKEYMYYPPLFVHQFSQAFINFKNINDGHANYFINSVYATLSQREMCAELGATRFPKWGINMWGVSASEAEGDGGYRAWGGPPASGELDGTLVPYAPAGSIPFAPRECIDVLKNMYRTYGNKIWKRYGFIDAFNPHTGWMAPHHLAIDVGITMIQIENYRSQLIWKYFMKAPEVRRGLLKAGFKAGAGKLKPNSSFIQK